MRVSESVWRAQVVPSVPYGVIRRLAHLERKRISNESSKPYLRVFISDVGRRGYNGGLGLEVNGVLYRFHPDVKRYPSFHNGCGSLTPEGQQALGSGVPGFISSTCDWHWVQAELDLTHTLSTKAINQIAEYYQGLKHGTTPMPRFQARKWAEVWDQEIKPGHYNCTTFILARLSEVSDIRIEEPIPEKAFPALCKTAGAAPYHRVESELLCLLNQPEPKVEWLLDALAQAHKEKVNWRAFVKCETPAPEWLTWRSLLFRRALENVQE